MTSDYKKKKVLSSLFIYFFTNILACWSYFILFLILLAVGIINYDAKVFKIFIIVNLILLIILGMLYRSTKRKSLIVCECNTTNTTSIFDRIEIIDFIKSGLFTFNFINIERGIYNKKGLFIGLLLGTLTLITILHLMNTDNRIEEIRNEIIEILNSKDKEEMQNDSVKAKTDNILLEDNTFSKDIKINEVNTEKDKESEEIKMTLNDVIDTMLNSVCGVTIAEKSPTKSEKGLDDFSQDDHFSKGKTFSQDNRPDMSSVESLNRRANVISLLPFITQLPFLFTNLHNTKLLSFVAIELVTVGILLIVISKLFTNFYEMFDENKVFPVSVCLNARIIMLLRFAVVGISSCLSTEIFTLLKYDKLVYAAMGLIVICAILLDHNYKKTTNEIKKLNK